MSQAFPNNEQEYLTPPTAQEVDEAKIEKENMIDNALYHLNECISELYSLNADSLAMDLEEYRETIYELKEEIE